MRPRVVVVPSLEGSATLLAPFFAALGPSVDASMVPLPGMAGGPRPAGAPSTRAIAEEVLARRCGEAAVLLGVSLGGMVAQWLAAIAPARVARLVLASTTACALDAGEGALRAARLARCLLAPRDEATVCLATGVLSETPDARGVAEGTRADGERRRRDLLWLAAAAAGHDARAALAQVEAPTLVLSGARDRLVPLEAQRGLAAAIPGARHVVVEGAGHDLPVEAPAECARLVHQVLAEDGRVGGRKGAFG